jgi:hypothetical protein
MKIIKDGDMRAARFLQELHVAKVHQPHLLKSYTGFKQANKLYIISDQAAHDLMHAFENTNPGEHTFVTRAWLQAQMLGLAGALAAVHKIGTAKAGYIHDIKPPNVLVFSTQDPVLKLADWGCANVNLLNDDSSHKTATMGDNAYHPPESDKVPESDKGSENDKDSEDSEDDKDPEDTESDKDSKKMNSMPYDVWSMGCLYMDLLVWFTEGKRGYKQFAAARESQPKSTETDKDDSFHWEKRIEGKFQTVLKSAVLAKFEKLGTGDGNWSNMVTLIKTMLRTEPTQRPTAADVLAELELL